jgi:hypothetical protein
MADSASTLSAPGPFPLKEKYVACFLFSKQRDFLRGRMIRLFAQDFSRPVTPNRTAPPFVAGTILYPGQALVAKSLGKFALGPTDHEHRPSKELMRACRHPAAF